MAASLPRTLLVRHGETAWSLTGQHTGRTDVPLTPRGEENARQLGRRLAGSAFALVLASPLGRARRTCELAGYGDRAELCDDLLEWNYGDYEGLTSAEIRAKRPGWLLFRDGCPNGESPPEVQARLERLVARLHGLEGDGLLFAHGHILRSLASVWLGQGLGLGARLALSPASVSVLGYDHNRDEPVLKLWNDTSHLG
jgi:probable phosphoglycerate mutase